MALKILIVDDDNSIRCGMAKYIRLHTDIFSQIYMAKDGKEAIDTIFRCRPDLMLLDICMPFKSGIEVMKETERAGILPLTIIFSGYAEFTYAQKALKYGAREYLLKPMHAADILQRILELSEELRIERVGGGGGERKIFEYSGTGG